ncbi:MAG TPA: hypothetical protein VG742_09625 [Dongiaceae bacterium]|nr:hypothetical protein [Dongiaceae bacterium]
MRGIGALWTAGLLAAALMVPGAGTATAQSSAQSSPSIVVPGQPAGSDLDNTPLRHGPCPVPPAQTWSQVEKDAWQRICAGIAANLGAQPSPDNEDSKPKLPKDPLPERKLSTAFLYQILSDPRYLEAVTFRGIVIRNADFPETVDLSHLVLDKPLRIEGSRFFKPLMMRQFRSSSDLDLSNSNFLYNPPMPEDESQPLPPPALDLTEARIDLSLTLRGVQAGDAVLSDIVVGRHVQLDRSVIYGRLYLNGAHIAGMLWLRDAQLDAGLSGRLMDVGKDVVLSFMFAGAPGNIDGGLDWKNPSATDIDLSNSHIQGTLSFGRGVGIAMPPELSQLAREEAEQKAREAEREALGETTELAQRGNTIDIREDERFAGERYDVLVDYLNLGQVDVGGDLAVRDSKINYVNLDDARAGGDLWLTNGEFFEASLSATNVGGFLLLQDTTIKKRLSLESAEIGRHLVMGPQTRIEDQLHMPSLNVHGGFYANGATVQGAADLQSAVVGGDLMLTRGTTFIQPIDASFARIGQSLDLNGGRFDSVNLTGAVIGGELRLVAGRSAAEFTAEAFLDLSNARADSLQDVTDVWPDHLDLVGFTYRQFGGSETPKGPGIPVGSGTQSGQAFAQAVGRDSASCQSNFDSIRAALFGGRAEPHDPSKLLCWLARQQPFSPAPYKQLASVLQQAGEPNTAVAVLHGGRMRQWNETPWWPSFGPKIATAVPWALTGFGNYPFRMAFWVLVLVVVGMVVFARDPSPEFRSFSKLQLLIYSLDMLMPVVHLRHRNYQIELHSWVRYYLYAHRIAGYVLLTFLAAALISGGGLD